MPITLSTSKTHGVTYHTVKTATGEYTYSAVPGEDRRTCLRRHALEMLADAQEQTRRAMILLEAGQ